MSTYTDFVNFLEDGNRYRAEIFRVHWFFKELSNDISHFVVAQKFLISTCLKYVDKTDFVNFPEDYNRNRAEVFRVH